MSEVRSDDVPEASRDAAVEVALLDRDGVIVGVNDAWERFCLDNGGDPTRSGVGVSFLDVCAASAEPTAAQAADAVRTAVAGSLPAPVSMTIDCDAPGLPRRFDLLVSSRMGKDGRCLGATISLAPTGASDDTSAATGAASVVPRLDFPDLPRLRLEETLTDLTLRAQEVLRTQGRLRALLRAYAVVAGDLRLPLVQQSLARAARDLVGGDLGGLVVPGPDGTPQEIVHAELDPQTVTALSEGGGGRALLALVSDRPGAVRADDVAGDPLGDALPDHPQLRSLLVVPVRVRGQLFAALFVTSATPGLFTEEDEELLLALAGTAAVAVDNARLYEDAERRQRWESASTELTQRLFSGDSPEPLETALGYAMQAAGGDFAVLAVRDVGAHVRLEAVVGRFADELRGLRMPRGESILTPVLEEGRALLIDDYGLHGTSVPRVRKQVGSAVAVPLFEGQRVVAAISIGRVVGHRPFGHDDVRHLERFVGHAGVAMRLDRARADRETLHMLQEHERIAADLHDHVVQEIFAVGMGLQGMLPMLGGPEQRDRVTGYVEALDDTIRRIRSTIFQLEQPAHAANSLKQRLLDVAEAEREALGFAAQVDFSGALDVSVPGPLTDDVVAVVREALSNVARHSRATHAWVLASVAGDLVSVDVVDDGVGIGKPGRSSGLTNMRRRAERYGGSLDVSQPATGGTHLVWTANLAARPATPGGEPAS